MKTRDLVTVAVYAACYVVIELMDHVFGIFKMPEGGSLTVSVVVIIFASYHLGFKKALVATIIAFVVRFIVLPPTLVVHPFQFLLDYILAPGSYALCVLIPDIKIKRIGIPIGVILCGILQFTFHALSGFMFYIQYHSVNTFWSIMQYTSIYVGPTIAVAFVIVLLTKKRFLKMIRD